MRGESFFACCGADRNTPGCCVAEAHVSDTLNADALREFTPTPVSRGEDDPRNHKVYALDCEMVYGVWGPELARVSVVDMDNKLVLDLIVKPHNTIIDYNTRFSGLTANQAQNRLFEMVNEQSILIGHSLESDLKAMRIRHERVVDTAVVFEHSSMSTISSDGDDSEKWTSDAEANNRWDLSGHHGPDNTAPKTVLRRLTDLPQNSPKVLGTAYRIQKDKEIMAILNDLALPHPKKMSPRTQGFPFKRALRNLASDYLQKIIQEDDSELRNGVLCRQEKNVFDTCMVFGFNKGGKVTELAGGVLRMKVVLNYVSNIFKTLWEHKKKTAIAGFLIYLGGNYTTTWHM
ncbi:exonuclease [Necator americanus]|uniref:Exonuclease n=1 Tax=Necator americanus TaxID=51031 RepID=W2TFU9_NECAM|nr:exonuclease [Necator americanus]ETN80915.1 exonuclease [Necator americanus]